jgi:hypothetical protein
MTALVMAMSVYAAALLTSETAIAQNKVESGSPSIPGLEVAVHFSPATPDSGEADLEAIARETEDSLAGKMEQPAMTPTRSSFPAKWQPVRRYGLPPDVSTTPSFDSYVNSIEISMLATQPVASLGLDRGTKYYYRVRPYTRRHRS